MNEISVLCLSLETRSSSCSKVFISIAQILLREKVKVGGVLSIVTRFRYIFINAHIE